MDLDSTMTVILDKHEENHQIIFSHCVLLPYLAAANCLQLYFRNRKLEVVSEDLLIQRVPVVPVEDNASSRRGQGRGGSNPGL